MLINGCLKNQNILPYNTFYFLPICPSQIVYLLRALTSICKDDMKHRAKKSPHISYFLYKTGHMYPQKVNFVFSDFLHQTVNFDFQFS